MALKAVESDELSGLLWAKTFCFYIIHS